MRALLLAAGAAVPGLGLLALAALLACGRFDLPLRPLLGISALMLAALPQGMLLPLCVRVREERFGPAGRISWFWLANLAGATAGAFLFAERAAAAFGRVPALGAAGAAAALAALLAAALARPAAATPQAPAAPLQQGRAAPAAPLQQARAAPAAPARMPELGPRAAALLLGAATAWVVGLEGIHLRLGVLWLGGMQDALSALLAASLLALAAGALLVPPLAPRGRAGVALVLCLAALGSAWPLCAAPALEAVRARGALPLALVLVGPSLFAFGGLVPVLFRAAAAGRPGEAALLGSLLVHEAWGALLGGPLLFGLFLPRVGLAGALALLCFSGGAAALVLGRAGLAPAAVAALVGALALAAPAPARASPPLANPALHFLAFEEDADFAVSVVDDGLSGERTLLTDGFRAAGDGPEYRYMRLLGHLPLLLHPAPRRACVLALGTGTTLGAVALHPEVEEIEVLELSRAVVRQAPHFLAVNGGALEDPRVRVVVGDGRHALAARAGAYDVLTLEPLLPDSPFAVYLYTREFYAAARRALAPGGLVCQWVPPHALEPAVFDAVVDAFARSFPHASLWLFDTQLVLIGGDEPAALHPGRFPGAGPLHAALQELGVAVAPRLAAHRVGDGAAWPRGSRPLTDADPWVLYRPRRAGAALLADLPRNLRSLEEIERPPELPGAADLWRGQRALSRARAAHAWDEALARGATCDDPLRPDLARELATAEALLGRDDPALSALRAELAFLDALRDGVALLGGGAAQAALPRLVSAAELRPDRGDVHLYLSAALQALGADSGARAAWDAARERCPRILETGPGERARALGFAPPR